MNLKESRLQKPGQECLRMGGVRMWSRQCFWSWGPFCGLISCPNHLSLFLPFLGFFGLFLCALSTWNLTLQWAHASGGLLVHLFAHQSLVLGKFGPTRHHSNQPDHSEHHDLRQAGSKHLQRDVSITILTLLLRITMIIILMFMVIMITTTRQAGWMLETSAERCVWILSAWRPRRSKRW